MEGHVYRFIHQQKGFADELVALGWTPKTLDLIAKCDYAKIKELYKKINNLELLEMDWYEDGKDTRKEIAALKAEIKEGIKSINITTLSEPAPISIPKAVSVKYNEKDYEINLNLWEKYGKRRIYLNEGQKKLGFYCLDSKKFGETKDSFFMDEVKKAVLKVIPAYS